MNKVLKIMPVFLAVIIVMLAVSIPVMAMSDKKKDNNAKTVVSAAEKTVVMQDAETLKVDNEKEEASDSSSTGSKAMAAAIVVGLAAAAGAIGMGMAISKSAEGISRQPEAAGNIRTSLMLGLVFIETAIIYALIVAILIIFVM